jgi:hypothetical protein
MTIPVLLVCQLCAVRRQNTSLSLSEFFQLANPRNVFFRNLAQPVSKATVAAVVRPAWRDITQAEGFHYISLSLKKVEL